MEAGTTLAGGNVVVVFLWDAVAALSAARNLTDCFSMLVMWEVMGTFKVNLQQAVVAVAFDHVTKTVEGMASC